MARLQRIGALRGRPRIDLVDEALHVRQLRPCVVAQHARDRPRPAPHRHVGDRVALADHVAAAGKALVDDAPVAPRLEIVAVHRVRLRLRREMLEVHRLPAVWADPRRDEHQPRQQLAAGSGRVVRQELAGFLGEIQQNRVAVEHDRVAVGDRRRLRVRIDRLVRIAVLLALAGIDGHELVRHAGLLEEQRDLGRVRRRVIEEAEHRLGPPRHAG